MTNNDRYRQNPARDAEKLAIAVLTDWVGALGTVVDLTTTGGPDFRIDYQDGRTAIGEITWHEDPRLREMWANTFRQEYHQTVQLDPGMGTWWVYLVLGAQIGRLHAELPGFIRKLIQDGCDRLDVVESWPHGEQADGARRLGIEHIEHMPEGESSAAFYFMPGSGGVVPTDPNVIVDWIEEVLTDPAFADITSKLLPIQVGEHHVFLMSGSATPFGVAERLRRLDSGAPTRPPTIPEGISHIWCVSQFGRADALLWTREGWSTHSVPSDGLEM